MTKKSIHKKPVKKSTKKKGQKKTHTVIVTIPRYAKLIVRRKSTNPYLMEVNDNIDNVQTKRKWYSDDYDPAKAQ